MPFGRNAGTNIAGSSATAHSTAAVARSAIDEPGRPLDQHVTATGKAEMADEVRSNPYASLIDRLEGGQLSDASADWDPNHHEVLHTRHSPRASPTSPGGCGVSRPASGRVRRPTRSQQALTRAKDLAPPVPSASQRLKADGYDELIADGMFSVSTVDIPRRFVDDDLCFAEDDINRVSVAVVATLDEVEGVLAELGVSPDALEPPWKNDFPL